MTLLKENIMKRIEEKHSLNEGAFTKGKFNIWYEELPGLAKILSKLQVSAKKYIDQAEKDFKSGKFPEMDNPDYMALEITFESQPVIGRHIFKKDQRGKTWLKVALRDGNGVAPHLLKQDKWGPYTVEEITINTKLI